MNLLIGSQGSDGLQGNPEFAEVTEDGSVRGIQTDLRQGANLMPVGAPIVRDDICTWSLGALDQIRARVHLQILALAENAPQ
jgi:hypothetical protein